MIKKIKVFWIFFHRHPEKRPILTWLKVHVDIALHTALPALDLFSHLADLPTCTLNMSVRFFKKIV
jgi:hypothetical protein